jgi:predicted regulator of Ras-like GTPase activity (Roadblock/LC7/MglB family)
MTYRSGATAPTGGDAPSSIGTHDVQWLLQDFAAETSGVTHAVIISLDGLQLGYAGQVGIDLADQLAACTAGLLGLANRCGSLLGSGATEHVTVRFGGGHLLCMRIGETAGLMVAAEPGSDLRVIAYAMSQFVSSVTDVIAPPRRNF